MHVSLLEGHSPTPSAHCGMLQRQPPHKLHLHAIENLCALHPMNDIYNGYTYFHRVYSCLQGYSLHKRLSHVDHLVHVTAR